MKKITSLSALALCCVGTAHAGGIERSTGSVGFMFEEGTYAEFTYGSVSPDVSGMQAVPLFSPGEVFPSSSGDMTGDYTTWAIAFKTDLSERLSLGFLIDQPLGADVNYAPDSGYAYGGSSLLFGGSTAEIENTGFTAILRYEFPSNFSIHGGLRHLRTSGEVALFNGYQMRTDTAEDFGYLVGIAWEKPEIAARVALTYQSSITHDFNASETILPAGIIGAATSFATEVPQSVTLDFQTGIMADTLLFGSVRWVDWTAFDITPTLYATPAGLNLGSLVDYTNDTITYSLGLGRKFSDKWSGAVTLGYEKEEDGFSGNLGPTDGYKSLGLALTRTAGNVKITGGARYIWIGDAETQAPAPYPAGTTLARFQDNEGVALGLRIGYMF
ncbi:long-subunit fatty acid transport protein [Rhodovulum bhavnagarense]|uniref:Long-subunit fatty acid transport protein n=1 Tax=Rhodovulum bhavnagarense TaxID=992286 RepID=A0A4R2RB54_9RHOB|nr:hypothetical protein [Rhodovulum bhavnagarense]TCP60552.1 long-subunit fatty acid transport protein [Rhodovulum bhavnagarense]